MRKLDARQMAREKSLFRYSSALERADFSAVAAVLQEAERDPLLAQMIAEINMVYESETFRPSPSLNHSSNHQKDLLMTTIVLNNRQRPMQRWLPITLAAACVSVLFIGALMLRPIRPNNIQTGIQVKVSATPTAAATATIVPSPTAASAIGIQPTIPPTIVQPDVQLSTGAAGTPVCGGTKIITEDAVVYAQPSENSVAVGRIPSGTQAETLATGFGTDDSSTGANSYWFFIKADVNGSSVQGWVSARIARPSDPAAPCPANAVVEASGVVLPPTLVPIAVEPVFSVAVPSACNSAITVEGTTLHVINQVDTTAIFAAPLTINSDAAVVGEFAAKSDAVLLYQQYDQQSAPVGALWYLIMTNGEGDKQITGWVSASSITTVDGCADAGTVNATAAIVSPAQIGAITGVAVTGSTQAGTCRIMNSTAQAATVFAAPLTADSNAPVVGTLPAQSGAVVIFQNYDQQSAPIGALWYLITTNGVNTIPVTGWISANSINATNNCAPEQLTGVTLETAGFSTGAISAVQTQGVATSGQSSRCTVINQTAQTATVYASPLTTDSNAAVVGEFPAGSEAVIIAQNYDGQSDPNSALWYLIATSGDKSVKGWISASTINSWMKCASEVANADAATEAIPQAAVGGGTVPPVPDTAPLGICHVINGQRESVPVFSEPSSKGDESTLVNNLTPNVPATVLYQQQNKETGAVWYLIIAVMDQGKQISGWVSADSVKVVDRCPVVS